MDGVKPIYPPTLLWVWWVNTPTSTGSMTNNSTAKTLGFIAFTSTHQTLHKESNNIPVINMGLRHYGYQRPTHELKNKDRQQLHTVLKTKHKVTSLHFRNLLDNKTWYIMQNYINYQLQCQKTLLTHWGLVTPYGDRDLGQHWLR